MHITKKIVLLAMLVMAGIHNASADSNGRAFYAGAFAGAGTTDNQDIEQTATAYKRGKLAHDVNNDPQNLLLDVKGNAKSYQTRPSGVELINGAGTGPVNHFNSEKHDAVVAFTEQAKVGIRAEIDTHWSAFAEYRYLHVESSQYKFGSTDYPGYHVETSHWKVENDGMNLHAGLVGVQYAF